MKTFFLASLTILFTGFSYANDIQLANTGLSNQNIISHTVEVKFDVNWKNSWRTSTNESNYDGAWLFVKFRKVNTSLWQHCSFNIGGFTSPAGSTVKVSADLKGFWVYSSANQIGDVNYTGGKVIWNYGSNGVLDADSVEIRVFAVEMVYIPQGSYYLGTGGSENYHFQDSTSVSPYIVTSDAAINFGNTIGKLSAAGYAATTFVIPATFPKGYTAFWIMKYECSQQQYVDFLNNLDLVRATNNNGGGFTGTHPALIAPQPERAYGMSSGGMRDWADWGAMRPMTELEYEKACRGANIMPVPNEYPWGNTTIVGVSSLNNVGASNESQTSSFPYGNCNYTSSYNTAMRCGLFARAGNGAFRDSSGATYYGVMEMGGNIWEKAVRVDDAASRLFTATIHGDGNLDASGGSDITTWNNAYYGIRGTGYGNPGNPGFAHTSDRYYSVVAYADANNSNIGFRLVRTAE